MTWQQGFIRQGQSDFLVYQLLQAEHARDPEQVPFCHPLHYLQMACEKLAKGLASHGPDIAPPRRHDSLLGWVRSAKVQCPRRLMALCRCRNKQQFSQYMTSLENIADLIDRLAPAVADAKGTGENAEYPWKDSLTGNILYPAGYGFPKFSTNQNQLIKLIEFMTASYQFGFTYTE